MPSSLLLCSECNSNRDSVLSYTSVRSNSSYLGSDEMGSGECRGLCSRRGVPQRDSVLFIFILLCFTPCYIVFYYFAWCGSGFPSVL